MSASNETRRSDFEYITGRPASVEEMAGSGSVRLSYETDGTVRQIGCTALHWHGPEIQAEVEKLYPPEKDPLLRTLVELAYSIARDDPDGSKRAASEALDAAAKAAVERHWPTGHWMCGTDQPLSGGRHGVLVGIHASTAEVKEQLELSGDPRKSLLWLAPIERGQQTVAFDLIGTRRRPLSLFASELAILMGEQLELTVRSRGRRVHLTKPDAGRLEDWIVANLSCTTAALGDEKVPFARWVEEVNRRLHPPMGQRTA